MSEATLGERFEERCGRKAAEIFRAPARVNLIGEHTDYNDGFVMPAAIDLGTFVAVSQRSDRRLAVHSMQFDQSCEINIDTAKPRGDWTDYVGGVAVMLERAGFRIGGANLLIASDVPLGAGLSSSAALEVAVALALAPEGIEPTTLAKLCQRAENEFVGVQCGIMDQFVACHARAGTLLMLDCRSLEYAYVRLPGGVKLVIANTMVRHDLAAGEYNKRRAECAKAAAYFGKSLRDVTLPEVVGAAMPDLLRRRARHVVTENARVMEARAGLDRGDLRTFGNAMSRSHASLRDDYEVSCAELDALVAMTRDLRGVHGSRMTGGGFGGCTISLVEERHLDEVRRALMRVAEVYVSSPAGAAVEIVDF